MTSGEPDICVRVLRQIVRTLTFFTQISLYIPTELASRNVTVLPSLYVLCHASERANSTKGLVTAAVCLLNLKTLYRYQKLL